MTTENVRAAGDFLVHEAVGHISRETGVVTLTDAEGVLQPGTVLGQITASGKYVAHDDNATDGSEIPAALLYIALRGAGDHRATVIVRRGAFDEALVAAAIPALASLRITPRSSS